MRVFLLVVLSLLAGVSVTLKAGQMEGMVKDDSPSEYVVKKGDSLWEIAGYFLNHPWQWPEIWNDNPQIENPHLIYPNDTIVLAYVDGEPTLSIGKRAYIKKLPLIKQVSRDEPIGSFPAKVMDEFLMSNQIQSERQLQVAPHVIAAVGDRIYIASGDEFYVHGALTKSINSYGVFREGDSYIDPDSKEVLGYHVTKIGTARVVNNENKTAIFKATEAKMPIRRGDRLLVSERDTSLYNMSPKPFEGVLDGRIIALGSGRTTSGPMEFVALNRGKGDGLETGDLLDILIRGELLKMLDSSSVLEAPQRRIGSLLIFAVYEEMSHGIILEASREVTSGSIVKNP